MFDDNQRECDGDDFFNYIVADLSAYAYPEEEDFETC